jgi:hypothetical protein
LYAVAVIKMSVIGNIGAEEGTLDSPGVLRLHSPTPDRDTALTFFCDGPSFFPEVVRRDQRRDACCNDDLLHARDARGIEDACGT